MIVNMNHGLHYYIEIRIFMACVFSEMRALKTSSCVPFQVSLSKKSIFDSGQLSAQGQGELKRTTSPPYNYKTDKTTKVVYFG